LAEAFDGGENFVGRFGPFVGLGVFVVARDEGADVGFRFVDSGVNAASQLLSRKLGKPAFDPD
jgi:hypothetical protein